MINLNEILISLKNMNLDHFILLIIEELKRVGLSNLIRNQSYEKINTLIGRSLSGSLNRLIYWTYRVLSIMKLKLVMNQL